MYNERLDALAAEYVLGTLAADERIDADTLIATDPGFREIVHRWERRLGELNGTVEAAEPPPEDKIEFGTSALARSDEVGAALAAAPAEGEAVAVIEKAGEKSEAAAETKAEAAAETKAEAAAETKAEAAAETKAEAAAEAKAEEANGGAARGEGEAAQPTPPAAAMSLEGGPKAEAKPDAISAPDLKPQPRTPLYPPETESTQLQPLVRRLRRWRIAAAASSLVAIALAALMALRAAAPDRIVLRALLPEAARPTPPASVTPLVAVLQQEPSSPAFLLTIDPAARTLTVRRVAAKAQVGHSYELWVQAAQAKPRALGLVGDSDYTQQPLPSDFEVDAMRKARYEISFEPTGGSKSGAPTGPILFTGTLVDSAQPPPPAPKG
jgi:anti-sigma-K factor RskA